MVFLGTGRQLAVLVARRAWLTSETSVAHLENGYADTSPTFCSTCKEDGVVDINSKRCAYGKRHSYCFPGDSGKKNVKTSAREMAMARGWRRGCSELAEVVPSRETGNGVAAVVYDSDPQAEFAAEAREKRQDAAAESRHLKRLASGWHKVWRSWQTS